MQNITILVQSFFSQKKTSILQKKVLAIQLFVLPILDSCVRSIANKTFFQGSAKKKKIDCAQSFPNTFRGFKKMSASKIGAGPLKCFVFKVGQLSWPVRVFLLRIRFLR